MILKNYFRGQEELSEMEKTLQEQKQICKDIEADIESCKKRESELLELTSNLSAKNAQLQSDNITVSNKVSNEWPFCPIYFQIVFILFKLYIL